MRSHSCPGGAAVRNDAAPRLDSCLIPTMTPIVARPLNKPTFVPPDQAAALRSWSRPGLGFCHTRGSGSRASVRRQDVPSPTEALAGFCFFFVLGPFEFFIFWFGSGARLVFAHICPHLRWETGADPWLVPRQAPPSLPKQRWSESETSVWDLCSFCNAASRDLQSFSC